MIDVGFFFREVVVHFFFRQEMPLSVLVTSKQRNDDFKFLYGTYMAPTCKKKLVSCNVCS